MRRIRRVSYRSGLSLAAALVVGAGSLASAANANAATHNRRHRHEHHARRHLRTVIVPVLAAGRGGDPGDDYPAKWRYAAQDSEFDNWGEYNRECTSFAAWALASRNGFTMPFHANAIDWGATAAARGYVVNSTPAVGSIAWSNRPPFGHVAYVEGVGGGSVYIEEYNHYGNGTYDGRRVPASTFTAYIHFKDIQAPTTPLQVPPVPVPGPPTGSSGGSTGTGGGTPAPPPSPPLPPSLPPPAYSEATGGVTHTWTNYSDAGGTEGPSIPNNATVQIACKLTGFTVADGNTWWYRIASAPWNGAFYASADAFYNNGATSGSLIGTPFVDSTVANC